MESNPSVADLLALKAWLCDAALAHPDVTGIDVGLRERGGVITDEPTIRLHVKRKTSDPERPLPTHFGALRLDIVERSYTAAEDATRYDPIEGGARFGKSGASRGTIGAMVNDNASGATYALTAQHCCQGASPGDGFQQPSSGAPRLSYVRGAVTDEWDAAVLELRSGENAIPEIVEIGEVNGVGTVSLGSTVRKRGYVTGLTTGTVTAVSLTTTIGYQPPLGDRVINDMFEVTSVNPGPRSMCWYGDSGSGCVDADEHLLGLLCSFAQEGHIGIFCKATNVCAGLGIHVPPDPPGLDWSETPPPDVLTPPPPPPREPVQHDTVNLFTGEPVGVGDEIWVAGSFTRIRHPEEAITPNPEDQKTMLGRWVGTAWERYQHPNSGVATWTIYDLKLDPSGRLWAAGSMNVPSAATHGLVTVVPHETVTVFDEVNFANALFLTDYAVWMIGVTADRVADGNYLPSLVGLDRATHDLLDLVPDGGVDYDDNGIAAPDFGALTFWNEMFVLGDNLAITKYLLADQFPEFHAGIVGFLYGWVNLGGVSAEKDGAAGSMFEFASQDGAPLDADYRATAGSVRALANMGDRLYVGGIFAAEVSVPWVEEASQHPIVGTNFNSIAFYGLQSDLGDTVYSLGSDGLVVIGTIDIAHRPVVTNEDGSISTVRSISFEEDGVEVLIPTVLDGPPRVVEDSEAIAHYGDTGEHLGKFSSVEAADEYATRLHDAYDPTTGAFRLSDGSMRWGYVGTPPHAGVEFDLGAGAFRHGHVNVLTPHPNGRDLYVGGLWGLAGGDDSCPNLALLRTATGTFEPVGPTPGEVTGLVVAGKYLYASGDFGIGDGGWTISVLRRLVDDGPDVEWTIIGVCAGGIATCCAGRPGKLAKARVRQWQRDDENRIRSGGNQPTSLQRSIRRSLRNVYS